LEENEGRMSDSMVPGLVCDSRKEKKKNIVTVALVQLLLSHHKFQLEDERRVEKKRGDGRDLN
jgi:hypothetical protein